MSGFLDLILIVHRRRSGSVMVDRVEREAAPGRRANRRGVDAKNEIEDTLTRHGYRVQRRVTVGEDLFGRQHMADIVIENAWQWPDGLAVEVRSQETSGTAEQKLVFLVESIRHGYDVPAAIVLLGRGFSESVLDWLKDQVDGKHLVAVAAPGQFESWIARARAS